MGNMSGGFTGISSDRLVDIGEREIAIRCGSDLDSVPRPRGALAVSVTFDGPRSHAPLGGASVDAMLDDVVAESHEAHYPRSAYFFKQNNPQHAKDVKFSLCEHVGMSADDEKKRERDLAVAVGQRIRYALKEVRKIKQVDLCRELPWLETTTLNDWIHGRRMLSLEKAMLLAPALQVSPAFLLTLEDMHDPREQALLEAFRATDERGKKNISRLAQSELVNENDDTIDNRQSA